MNFNDKTASTMRESASTPSVGLTLYKQVKRQMLAGLSAGDRWCLCAERWAEALAAGMAPKVVLEATHARTLEWADLDDLRAHATD